MGCAVNLVEDFDNVSTDDCGYILITEREIADLRYSLIDDEGVECLIPLRWNSFHVEDSTLIILAEFDSPIMGVIEAAAYLDYFKRVTTLETVDADSVGHYVDWHMKSDMRADLLQAVKSFAWRVYDTGVVREWPPGINPAERLETL